MRRGEERRGERRSREAKKGIRRRVFFSSAGYHGYLALHSASWRMSTHRERRLILAATSQHRDGL